MGQTKDPEYQKKYREKNREKNKTYQREYRKANPDVLRKNRLGKYDLTIEQYEAMLKNQRGECKICERQNEDGRPLFVDHSHETGVVRGLLCHSCNALLGNARDSVETLSAGLEYLKKWSRE